MFASREAPSGEIQPWNVQVRREPIDAGCPNHDRCGIRQYAEEDDQARIKRGRFTSGMMRLFATTPSEQVLESGKLASGTDATRAVGV